MSITLKSASALVLAALLTLGATSGAQAGGKTVLTGGATGCCRQIMQ